MSKDSSFKFNLIPPKTKEELVKIKDRDNTSFYSFILVFTAIVIYFIFTLIQSGLISPRITKLDKDIQKQEDQITTFNSIKVINGELVVKSQVLSPILKRDIGTDLFLQKTESLTSNLAGVEILSYSRESSGDFVITVLSEDYNQVADLVQGANTDAELSDVFARQMGVDEVSNKVRATISFKINELTSQIQ